MAWFLRAVERPDGRWDCRFGTEDLGTTVDETTALMLLVTHARERGGSHLFDFFLHRQDGRVERRRPLGAVEETG